MCEVLFGMLLVTTTCMFVIMQCISDWVCCVHIGDVAFLLHILGMNVAAATHGNPWVYVLREEEDLETSEDIVWREADDYYLHSHCLPPEGAPFWLEREWPWICDCCGEVFESAESFKDPEKIAALRKMRQIKRGEIGKLNIGDRFLCKPLCFILTHSRF